MLRLAGYVVECSSNCKLSGWSDLNLSVPFVYEKMNSLMVARPLDISKCSQDDYYDYVKSHPCSISLEERDLR